MKWYDENPIPDSESWLLVVCLLLLVVVMR